MLQHVRTCTQISSWLESYIYTVYDRMYGDFPAKDTVPCTQRTYMVLAKPAQMSTHIFSIILSIFAQHNVCCTKHTCTCTETHTHMQTHAHKRTHTHTHTHAHTHTRTHTHTRMHASTVDPAGASFSPPHHTLAASGTAVQAGVNSKDDPVQCSMCGEIVNVPRNLLRHQASKVGVHD